ncbi:hypothetical protein ACQJBY_039969 [Aegilops geniculata]
MLIQFIDGCRPIFFVPNGLNTHTHKKKQNKRETRTNLNTQFSPLMAHINDPNNAPGKKTSCISRKRHKLSITLPEKKKLSIIEVQYQYQYMMMSSWSFE